MHSFLITHDSDSFSRDVEFFTNDFTENIPDDSDDEDEDFYSYNMSGSALTLNVGLSFHTWKAAFQHINNGLINKEHLISHSKKPSKSCHTNCKWSVNLSRPIKNNPGPLIFVTTFFNEHSTHNLDVFAYNFKESKAFMKSITSRNKANWK
ncbi:hypothetical protein RhiirC2_789496 [Rhizophagus irregularis]|uniref:Uncharacterized protein n=1 Tax=Rhizophagus irregularis TaxID=588596 RepID=A0A2N1MN47_9GLOM|nr:hypothetical protein RhiirC2_789496 [Rhizophagus irregularis]